MEYTFDCDIIGEIMIPLNNNINDDPPESKTPKHNFHHKLKFNPLAFRLDSLLVGKNYKDFRSTLFQGELLRFFIVLKLEKKKDMDIMKLINNLYIKFEFDSSCDTNEKSEDNSPNKKSMKEISSTPNRSFLSLEDNDSSQIQCDAEGNNISDLFSLQRNTLFNKFSNPRNNSYSNSQYQYDYKNKNYDFISRRHFIEEKGIAILEVLRHIVVPNRFLNKNLIMKLDIMLKNENEYVDDLSLSDVYSSGIYNELKEFTIIKTLFKEVKIIRPLIVSKTRQIDVLPDVSLLQIKIENKTSTINFTDNNLRNSKFLTGEIGKKEDVLNYGISLVINDIQVLNDETTLDKKTTINLKNLEQNINKESTVIPFQNVHFTLMNKEFPMEINPGEELVLVLKVHKSAFISEKSLETESDGIDKNVFESDLKLQDKSNSNFLSNKSLSNGQISNDNIYSNYNSNYKQSNLQTNSGILVTNTIKDTNSIANKVKIYESGLKRDQKFFPRKDSYNSMASLVTNSNNQVMHNYNFRNFANQINEMKSPVQFNFNLDNTNKEIFDESNIYFDDEIIKVILSTPIILDIASDKFYDNLFMTIPIKWHNEITRFLKIEIEMPQEIYLHQYFVTNLKARNISNSQMDLLIEISESNCEFVNDVRLETEVADEIPSILPEMKSINIGILNPNEEKIIEVKFLTLKNGFNSFPTFSIVDKNTKKKFFICHTGKIHVKED